jgi:hypothetical protein
VANSDAVFANHNFLDQQSRDALTFQGSEGLDVATHVGEEIGKSMRESQIGCLVRQLRVERFRLPLQALLALAQPRYPSTQFVQ